MFIYSTLYCHPVGTQWWLERSHLCWQNVMRTLFKRSACLISSFFNTLFQLGQSQPTTSSFDFQRVANGIDAEKPRRKCATRSPAFRESSGGRGGVFRVLCLISALTVYCMLNRTSCRKTTTAWVALPWFLFGTFLWTIYWKFRAHFGQKVEVWRSSKSPAVALK